MNVRLHSDQVRTDLYLDVRYGDRTVEEVHIWMMLLALDYLDIINSKGKVDLYYKMAYSQIYRGGK